MIEGGEHLWRCLRYIDLNMVRAGVVRDPAEWGWCGYQEFMGIRKRYRAVSLEDLTACLAPGQPPERVAERYATYVAEALKVEDLKRDPMWTESVAVGSEAYVREMGSRIDGRMSMRVEAVGGNAWTVREAHGAYGSFSGGVRVSP